MIRLWSGEPRRFPPILCSVGWSFHFIGRCYHFQQYGLQLRKMRITTDLSCGRAEEDFLQREKGILHALDAHYITFLIVVFWIFRRLYLHLVRLSLFQPFYFFSNLFFFGWLTRSVNTSVLQLRITSDNCGQGINTPTADQHQSLLILARVYSTWSLKVGTKSKRSAAPLSMTIMASVVCSLGTTCGRLCLSPRLPNYFLCNCPHPANMFFRPFPGLLSPSLALSNASCAS